jgi:excisionase family DNA binding protein
MNHIISIKELSLYLGIKEKTLYAKLAAKEIPHYKIARLVRFKKEEIDRWIEEKKIVPKNIDRQVSEIITNLKEKNRAVEIDRVIENVIEEYKNKGL